MKTYEAKVHDNESLKAFNIHMVEVLRSFLQVIRNNQGEIVYDAQCKGIMEILDEIEGANRLEFSSKGE